MNGTPSARAEEIRVWLIDKLCDELGLDASEVEIDEAFASFGIDSVQAVSICGDLEVWTGMRFPATLLWDFPTVRMLSEHLAQPSASAAVGYEQGLEKPKEPIAIIGLGCRFPGANSPADFWALLRDGVDAVTEVPADRWDVDAYYDPDPAATGKMNSRWGGFLDNVDRFDAQFFGVSPREAACMDPQQRLLLEVTWEALEDAGQVPSLLAGSRTGVFVGIGTIDYGRMQIGNLRTASNPYAGTGCALSIAANRISYVFNFRGPSVAVDTACSSSLVATHLACQSLWSGESSLALAGGVNVIIDPKLSVALAKGGFLSPDGRCRAFDSRANGYVRAEGVGVVVLKLLSKAVEDGDPIYALVRSTAVNQDGHSNGITAPNQQSQELLLREAYRLAGIPPGQVQYVETHGTGTSLGDPIEVKALGTVLGIDRAEGTRCALGSVKTNVGHAETAAGVVSLIKVALMMKHRAIPASLHFREPNPHIPFDTLPLYVQESFGPWPEGNGPAIAGISGFGFGGTNAHVVVSEAPIAPAVRRGEQDRTGRAQLLALSARDPEALKALAEASLSLARDENERPRLEDLSFTCGARRGHYDYRLALVARSWAEVEDGLDAFFKGETRPGMSHRRRASGRWPKVAFVFSGQGSQREQMGRQLLEQEPVFRAKIEECDALFRRHSGWSLVEQIYSVSRIDETEVTQPAIFMLQVALAALLESWGIRPDAVVGHSLGEIAAAHVSGALSLDDALRAIYHRGRLMQQTAGQGGTAAVGLSLDETRELLSAYEGRLSVAAHNGPRATTISGETGALDEVVESLRQKGIFCKKLRANHAFHSVQMDSLLSELEEALHSIRPGANPIPFFSTVTGGRFEGANLMAAYWSRNLREPVLFAGAVGAMLEDGYEVFLEVSPTSVLAGTVSRCASEAGQDAVVVPALREGEEERSSILGALGTLYTMGLPLDWRRLFEEGSRCVPLPHYPWQRERYWLETDDPSADSGAEMPAGAHPLLGRHLEAAQHQGTHFWQRDLNTRLMPWLADHKLQGAALLPGTAYVEMALAAAAEVFDGTPFGVSEIEFRKALFLSESETHTVQTILYPGAPGQAHFRIYSRRAGDDAAGSWSLHAAGQARVEDIDGTRAAMPPEEIRAVCTGEIAGPEFYDALRTRGFDYGPAFQGVERIWYRPGEALGRIRVTQPIEGDLGEYRLHPAVLDACTQVLGAAANILAGGENDGLYVPVGFAQVRAFESTGSQFWSHVTLREGSGEGSDTLHADIRLLDDAGRVLAEVSGVRCVRLERTAAQEERKIGDWLYEVAWQPAADAVDEGTEPEVTAGLWLLLTDSAGVGARLRELLEARGEACVSVSPGDDFLEVLAGISELADAPLRVVHLWNLDLPVPDEGADFDWKASVDHGCISLLHLVQTLVRNGWDQSGRLWVVTRGAHAVDGESAVAISQTPASGLAGVIAAEVSSLGCVRVDLDPEGGDGEVQRLLDELLRNAEPQIALRGSGRFVPRLVRSERHGAASETSPGAAKALEVPDAQSFRLEISPPYIFDNLSLRPFARRQPGKGEVEIEVLAAGLNFRDVLKAMGLYPGLGDSEVRLGDECAGRVVAAGEGVERFRVGDEVLAIASNGFGSHVTVDTQFVVPKPAGISFEDAATIPVAYSTAFYALHHVGRLQKGEKVLIHAAAGGVGLAAISLAQSMGAEIFATAGSDAKREYLKSLGVQHVMDSRSLDWAQEVLRLTGGEGVDVILNSLAGEAIRAGLASLRPFGRFVEIGKMDIYENSQVGLYPFRNNVAFSAVDMEQLFVRRPDLCQSILDELLARFRRGELRPIPHTVFPVTEAVGAFRYMAQRKNTGKIVLTFEQQRRAEDEDARSIVHADGTYLITGGLGGLGLKVARHLVDIGARNLALLGRGEPSEEARAALSSMREAGADIHIGKVDVADHRQLAAFLSNLPPLKGVVHAAGVLDDGIVMQLDEDRFYKVLRPKIAGAWNLHRATSGQPLDFFVLFSSIASVFSNPGQGNYVAANSFLDALAHYRRARGLPAVSINWGPWSEVGMASHLDPRRLEARGMGSISPDEGVSALEALLDHPPPQVAVLPISRARWERWIDAPSIASLLTLMANGDGSRARSEEGRINRGTILSADASERQRLLEAYLCEAGGRVLGMATSKLDVEQPLNRMGVDSLMAVELKHRVEADLGVDLPVLKVLEGTSMRHLASLLLERFGTAAG